MDGIEKSILLGASLERAWEAIADSAAFGRWFGAEFDGPFVAGTEVTGRIVPTTVDPAVAATQEPYRGAPMVVMVDAVQPLVRFAFRWHPLGMESADAPTTAVAFTLAEVGGGVLLTITETGFENLPEDARESARDSNDSGWEAQTGLIARYLASGV